MNDAILDIVLNKISKVPNPTTLNLFGREPMLDEFEWHLKNVENEFNELKIQLQKGSIHVPEHELNKIAKVAYEVEDIIDYYSYFLGQAKYLSVNEQKNTFNKLKDRIVNVGNIHLINSQCAQNEQLIQRGHEAQENSRLNEWLMDSTPGRTIISVWGTRSGSKTKLVKKVCENPEIKSNFHLYAYVSVPDCYRNQLLLRRIAEQLMEESERIEDDDLPTAIQGNLHNKSYLIVLDDFKDTEVWPILNSVFVQNKFGNKVVITTHSESIASLADENYVIRMHSFTDLPSYLRNCILYCGLFPRNYLIARKWITGLWIAEEFVEDVSYDDKTLEEVAEDYLRELIEYSQLKVVKKDIHGNVKQFIVHDYVALSAFRDDNFGVILHGSDPVELGHNTCRIFIEKSDGQMQFGSTNMLRSFILFDDLASASWIVDTLSNFESLQILCLRFTSITVVPDAIYKLRRLRCLDLAFTMVKEIKSLVQNLNLLQTLDLRHTLVRRLPKNIENLINLQHLYAAHPSLRAITVEGNIGNLIFLQTLRKIKINLNRIKNLEKLTKLKNLFIMEVKEYFVEKLLEHLSRMPNLKKLGIVMCTREVLNMATISAPKNLEKLYLEGRLDESTISTMCGRFEELKEFCMVMSGLCNDPLTYLYKMGSLVKLEINKAYDGVQLFFGPDWFPNLKKLHLYDMPNLSLVVIDKCTMKNLQCLRLSFLSNLKKVPTGLENLEKLEDIILFWMPDEFIGHAQFAPHVRITRLPR
ncbi:hypothetical protein LUZ61_016067 [Rhynchospora tenuis]|uniref:NB-ARC domain-containing protein n=1 Tax=Rhynchospora tenuis TaxID=198213 RepID=A0AAD5Z4U4_9POAL|nr:hypothetical protein LUZ61_016067 [Rhynchospora tenuis]